MLKTQTKEVVKRMTKRHSPKRVRRTVFPSYEEARQICVDNNIKSTKEYFDRYHELGLPSAPNKHYKKKWVDWYHMLSKSYEQFVPYKQAVKLCIKNNIKNQKEYDEFRKTRDDLPSCPYSQYDEFTNWYDFTGREKPGKASLEQHKKWMKGKTARWWMKEGHKKYKDQGAISRPDRIYGKPLSYFTGGPSTQNHASLKQHKEWLKGKSAAWWMKTGYLKYKNQGGYSNPHISFDVSWDELTN